ncbi:pyruvate kinase [Clostridium algidicarnis]|uniref:pyruvate kinase n=1 Tax=Clostridium algidicarnis TaxID=37659 RepID=UPI001C0E0841|nr:pyruvate kinase [Clostridium algidicarnis]MBU3207191.1 pyruvate kinase [Clostridium algidicarnis]
MRKTKIVCTIGPGSDNEEVLSEIIKSGMSVSRHNFSHGDHLEHKIRMDLVKDLSKKLNVPIAIMLDTKGPEIRTGDFNAKSVELNEGDQFTIYCKEEIIGDNTKCYVTYDELAEDVKRGDSILIDDGLVGLRVESVEDNKIHCTVVNSGVVSNHKGVNVPGVSMKLPSVTEKDIDDLKFGVEMDVDLIAASFIRKAADILEIRNILKEIGGDNIAIFAKIENQEGVDNINEIIEVADGIMVARGDLGVEIPIEKVPVVQKMIIEKCNRKGIPVITATQMLDSMMRNPRPTRAEASDVANAIFDGTDAIMLSGETANGKYPVESVATMSRIAIETEKELDFKTLLMKKKLQHTPSIPTAISLATTTTATELNAKVIITATQSGSTAMTVSKYRPKCPIIAVTPYERVARKLCLSWGVFPLITHKAESTDELIEKSIALVKKEGFVNTGDLVVMAAGIPINDIGSTNMMKVHVVE